MYAEGLNKDPKDGSEVLALSFQKEDSATFKKNYYFLQSYIRLWFLTDLAASTSVNMKGEGEKGCRVFILA